MGNYKRLFRWIAYAGYCIVFLFAIDTFEKSIPDQIFVKAGEEIQYEFQMPVTFEVTENSLEAAQNQTVGKVRQSYYVTCRLFGLFPVKDIKVILVDGDAVYVGGTPIGIYVKTNGVLVIGTGEVALSDKTVAKPSENIIKAGDYILSVNGKAVNEKEELQQSIRENGAKKNVLGINRNGEYIEVGIEPACSKNGVYMLGIWVRDDLAGIGTLTYYDENGNFGALGHAVSDGDVGEMIQMREGYVYNAQIIGVKKGKKGNPGELSGLIDYQRANCLGTIKTNTDIGIYGTLDGNIKTLALGDCYNICYKQDIKTGPATIISGFTGEKKEYAIEIETLDYSGREANKGILFKVTDEKLLNLTGGIVQGMSGSPIIQDGKLIGAVTHVFVSDSSMGYGIFIENMVE